MQADVGVHCLPSATLTGRELHKVLASSWFFFLGTFVLLLASFCLRRMPVPLYGTFLGV
jgi:hypothetical protein